MLLLQNNWKSPFLSLFFNHYYYTQFQKCGWRATRHVSPSPSTNTAQTPKRPFAKWTVAWCAVSASVARGRSRESEAAATTAVCPSGLPTPTSGASRAASEDISRATADVVVDDVSDATRATTTTIVGDDPEGKPPLLITSNYPFY